MRGIGMLRGRLLGRQWSSGESRVVGWRAQDGAVDLRGFDGDRIRNFCVISHVDHGKSTLSQRFLQMTNSSVPELHAPGAALFMDSLQVERERGITVHASSASLVYACPSGGEYLLNLVDTPGHVDFNFEVQRALQACEGAVLLVDATKGVQAQTISNFWSAFAADLVIIPVINKVDLDTANVPNVLAQLHSIFSIPPDQVLRISAKTGTGVAAVLDEVVRQIPPPDAKRSASLQALLFDSWYDRHVGVVMLWRLMAGTVRVGDKIRSRHSNREYTVADVGVLFPKPIKTVELSGGQVGYVTCGMKHAPEASPGDTYVLADDEVTQALPGMEAPRAVVFAGLFATAQDETALLADAMEKILLTDNSVLAHKESSLALGTGYRCGFLGVLHMEVFIQRLLQEYGLEVVATAPTVPYQVVMGDGSTRIIDNPAEFPDAGQYRSVSEPMVRATIVSPSTYVGGVIQLCMDRRAHPQGIEPLGDSTILRYRMPLAETISGFFDRLKELTSGYASYEYEPDGYEETDLVKLDILLNGKSADPLVTLVHRNKAREWGVKLTTRLRDVIHRQLFEVIIQAAHGNKILCRERIPPLRKNVTAKCYGGDMTRKRKLLDKQKEGKKRMRSIGNVELSQEAFFSVLKN